MIRRSFAEFHAQRALPNQKALLKRAQAAVADLAAAPWPECYLNCSREEVEAYAVDVDRCSGLTGAICGAIAEHRAAHAAYAPGRVVLFWPRGSNCPPEVAAVCAYSPAEAQRFGGQSRPETVVILALRRSLVPEGWEPRREEPAAG